MTGKGRISNAEAAKRLAQSQRDKQLARAAAAQIANRGARQRANAQMRSIPKGPPKKKQELFSQGALKSMQFAPRGHGYYDAFANLPNTACVAATTGPATVIQGHSSDTILGSSTVTGTYANLEVNASNATAPSHSGNSTLIAFNPGSSDDVIAVQYFLEQTTHSGNNPNRLVLRKNEFKAAQFAELGPTVTSTTTDAPATDAVSNTKDPLPTRRIESIPLRGSVRFRNITENFAVGGIVRVLRYNGGINMNMDSGSDASDDPEGLSVYSYLSICNMIRDSTRTKVFTGSELRSVHQSNSYPADFVRSMTFATDKSFFEAVRTPGYCTTLILIDDYVSNTSMIGNNNSYELQFMVQKAARFSPGSILHGLQRNLTVDPNTHSRASAIEDRKDHATKVPMIGNTDIPTLGYVLGHEPPRGARQFLTA